MLLRRVAEREASRVESVDSRSVLALLARVASMCRATRDPDGGISVDLIRDAFVDVCDYQPDEQGLQLVLRLPGLASAGASGREGAGESRRFVDEMLAEAAFGAHLREYFANPWDTSHPLAGPVGITEVSSGLSSQVAAAMLREDNPASSNIKGVLKSRLNQGYHDVVLFEAARCADELGEPYDPNLRPVVTELTAPELRIYGNGYVAHTLFTDSLIENIEFGVNEQDKWETRFSRCVISGVAGMTESEFRHISDDTEVRRFRPLGVTTSDIMSLPVDAETRVALTILKKVYRQKGSARRASALSRGLPLSLRATAPGVTRELVAGGYLQIGNRRGTELVAQVPTRRAEVLDLLDNPPNAPFWK